MSKRRSSLATVFFGVGIILGLPGCDSGSDSGKSGTATPSRADGNVSSSSTATSAANSRSGLDALWAQIPLQLLPTQQVVDDAIKVVEAKRQLLSVMKDREVAVDLPVLVTVTPNEQTANWDVEASPLPMVVRRGALLLDYSVELKAEYQEGNSVAVLVGAAVKTTVSDATTAKRFMQSPIGVVTVSGVIREVRLPTGTAASFGNPTRTVLSIEIAKTHDFIFGAVPVSLPIIPGPAVEDVPASGEISVGEALGASNRSLQDQLRSIQESVGKRLSMPLVIDGWGSWQTVVAVDPSSTEYTIQFYQPLPYASFMMTQQISGGGVEFTPMQWPKAATTRVGLAHLLTVPWRNGMGYAHWQGRAWCWKYNAKTQRLNRIPQNEIGWGLHVLEKDDRMLMWLPGDAVEEGLRNFPRVEFTLVDAEMRGPTDQERASGVNNEKIVLTVDELRLSE